MKTRENDANSLFVLRLNSSARSLEKIPLEATMLEALDHVGNSVTSYVTLGNDLESAARIHTLSATQDLLYGGDLGYSGSPNSGKKRETP